MGPIAALEIIKHLGTNGGGFLGANSSTPLGESHNALQPDLAILHDAAARRLCHYLR